MTLLYLHIHLKFVLFHSIQESVQTHYLRDGDKRRFWGVVHLCRQWGAWHGHGFVLHVVYSITKGLNGISCRDRDIKSLALDCHPSKKPASRQTVLSQLFGPLPNLWQLIEQVRMEWNRTSRKNEQRHSLFAWSGKESLEIVKSVTREATQEAAK